MRKFNQTTAIKPGGNAYRRGKLAVLGVLLLLALFVLCFAYYGVRQFFTNYQIQSPVVFRPIVVKRQPTKKPAPTPHQPRSKVDEMKKAIVPQVEASETIIDSFPKYLTDEGAKTREIVLDYLDDYYSGNQLIAFDNLIKKESGYRYDAVNEIGACGMPQSLPCEKMNCPLTSDGIICQAEWMKLYIENRYGSPLEAWNHSEQVNWY